jgi:hypothetical protein
MSEESIAIVNEIAQRLTIDVQGERMVFLALEDADHV